MEDEDDFCLNIVSRPRSAPAAAPVSKPVSKAGSVRSADKDFKKTVSSSSKGRAPPSGNGSLRRDREKAQKLTRQLSATGRSTTNSSTAAFTSSSSSTTSSSSSAAGTARVATSSSAGGRKGFTAPADLSTLRRPAAAAAAAVVDADDMSSESEGEDQDQDPMQFHATPKDLSANALQAPRPAPVASSHIFSRTSFSSPDLKLHSYLSSLLGKDQDQGGLGLATCTRVQSVALPVLRDRHNLLMKSQTGSGKTLAYLIPIIDDLLASISDTSSSSSSGGSGGGGGREGAGRDLGTRALIVAPTRELCAQIADVAAKLSSVHVSIVTGTITGGEKKKSEKARLRKGVSVLVCTPGRLLDHIKNTESFSLSHLRWLVLDEADRLLDMGFEQTILQVCSAIRGQRLPRLKEDKLDAKKGGASNPPVDYASSAFAAKRCADLSSLVHVMVSATLTKGVRQLAEPVMGNKAFCLIDADNESVMKDVSSADLEAKVTTIAATSTTSSARTSASDSNPRSTRSSGAGVAFFGDDDGDDDGGGMLHPATSQAGAAELKTAGKRVGLEEGERMEAPVQLDQYFMLVTCKWRLAALLSFLKAHSHQKVLVFFATCDSVDYHALLLRQCDWPVQLDTADGLSALHLKAGAGAGGGGGGGAWMDSDHDFSDMAGGRGGAKTFQRSADSMKNASMLVSQAIDPLEGSFTGMLGEQTRIFRLHGNIPQKTRMSVYKEFCAASSGVLLCTDVAARGLDLPRIDWILQYDPPCDTTDYIHRAGRTARRGLGGSALLFLLPAEVQYAQLLQSHGMHLEALSLQSLFLEAAKFIPGATKFKNVDELCAVILQRRVESVVTAHKVLTSAGRQAFRSFVRAYATHSSDTKGIFRVQSLHLGHVAKSFALQESPTALRHHEDVIGKIVNGVYAASMCSSGPLAGEDEASERQRKKRERDEKYSLSKQSSSSSSTSSSSRGRGGSGRDSKRSRGGSPSAPMLDADGRVKPLQKLRAMGGGGGGGGAAVVAPSGKFRKSEGGYFKKKLRDQANSEFSS